MKPMDNTSTMLPASPVIPTAEDIEKKLRIVLDDTRLGTLTAGVSPEEFTFDSTADIKPHEGLAQIIGQDNAKRGVLRNIKTRLPAYHCLTQGDPGVGKSFFAKVAFETINDLVIKIKEDSSFVAQ